MPKKVPDSDLIGKTFQRMTIIELISGSHNISRRCVCRCTCGNTKTISLTDLKQNKISSCGCIRKEPGHNAKKHGLRWDPLYNIWLCIKSRCNLKTNKSYKNYGGRGITVCTEWSNDPKIFINWCMENGWQRGLEIDRENNDGNYEPSNCRFVTSKVNCRNKGNNISVTLNGRTQCLTAWCEELGLSFTCMRKRIVYKKMEPQIAFSYPSKSKKGKIKP